MTNSLKRIYKKIKTIDIKNTDIFPIERTSFGLLEKEEDRKDRIISYIQEWKTKFGETAKSVIEGVEELEKTKEKLEKLNPEKNPKLKDFKSYFDVFNKEKDIIEKAKGFGVDALTSFKKGKADDNEVAKFLRPMINEEDQAMGWQIQIKNWPAGVAGMIFMVETIERFYLTNLPKLIEEKLNIEPVVKLEEIQEPLRKMLLNEDKGIFTILYSGFTSADERKDLNDFQQKINNGLTEIETLIDETRKSKEPTEDIEAIKKELSDLKEAWKNNFANRGLGGKEYLKNKELSVDAIVEAGESLKTYDNTFSYMDSKHSPDLVKEWWGKVRTYWKEKFLNNYGIGGGIEDTTLIKLKKYIEDKKEELNNRPNITQEEYNNLKKELDKWLKEFPALNYPNGAESIKELIAKLQESQGSSIQDKETIEILKNWCSDLIKIVHKYDRDPKLLETPPTPPNSPETKPSDDNEEIPPIKT